MIGWYIHHQGAGHLHRARAVQAELGVPVTGLSTLPRPDDWPGSWVTLEPDDRDGADDVRAGGRLHWAPLHSAGLRDRMAAVSAWIARERPAALVSDVSVEVALLARLHGVPVVTVVLPGLRSDPAHLLGFEISDRLVGCWPVTAPGMVPDLPEPLLARLEPVGGLSRFPVRPDRARRPGPPRAALLLGTGGSGVTAAMVASARAETPDWEWTVMARDLEGWRHDPYAALCEADVVVTHAGQNALAEVAAARRPAVVLPEVRPHDEQLATARVLADGDWPVVVRPGWPAGAWSSVLAEAAGLDAHTWTSWCDGAAARRFARILDEVAGAGDVAVA